MKILRYHCIYLLFEPTREPTYGYKILLNIKETVPIPNIESHHIFVFHVYFKQWIKDESLYLKIHTYEG